MDTTDSLEAQAWMMMMMLTVLSVPIVVAVVTIGILDQERAYY